MKAYLLVSLLSFFSLFLFASCSTGNKTNMDKKQTPSNDSYFKVGGTMLQKMNAAKDPKNHINSIREYALNNFSSLTENEYDLIEKTKPKIHYNSNTMEYSFAWPIPGKSAYLEVIATPPPDCTPIATFRRSRVYYP